MKIQWHFYRSRGQWLQETQYLHLLWRITEQSTRSMFSNWVPMSVLFYYITKFQIFLKPFPSCQRTERDPHELCVSLTVYILLSQPHEVLVLQKENTVEEHCQLTLKISMLCATASKQRHPTPTSRSGDFQGQLTKQPKRFHYNHSEFGHSQKASCS